MEQTDLVKAYKRLYNSEDGKVVLKSLMANCHTFDGTYAEEANKMYFQEGRRSVVFEILSFMEVDLDKVRKLYAESVETDWQ